MLLDLWIGQKVFVLLKCSWFSSCPIEVYTLFWLRPSIWDLHRAEPLNSAASGSCACCTKPIPPDTISGSKKKADLHVNAVQPLIGQNHVYFFHGLCEWLWVDGVAQTKQRRRQVLRDYCPESLGKGATQLGNECWDEWFNKHWKLLQFLPLHSLFRTFWPFMCTFPFRSFFV